MLEAGIAPHLDSVDPAVPFVSRNIGVVPPLSRMASYGAAPNQLKFKSWSLARVKPDIKKNNPVQTQLAALLAAIGQGDQVAFDKFYKLTTDRVYAIAHRILGTHEDAEDVVSTTFWQVWRSATRYNSAKSTVLGWLTMITRSRALDMRRRNLANNEITWDTEPFERPESNSVVDDLEDNYHSYKRSVGVRAMLSDLSAIQRQLLNMAYHLEYSHREIAQRTGLPLGTVKSHLRRTLIVLRQRMVA